MKKLAILTVAVFALSVGLLRSEARRSGTQGTIQDWSITPPRMLSVGYSSSTVTIISSSAPAAGLSISQWDYREIINNSDGDLMLLFDDTSYGLFTSSASVVLGSSDTWKDNGDYAIWGIWSDNTTSGGASGLEIYFKKP